MQNHSVPRTRFVLVAVVVLGAVVVAVAALTACGDPNAGSSRAPGPAPRRTARTATGDTLDGLVETRRRAATPADFDPVCRSVGAASLTGTYRELEGAGRGAVVITGSGEAADVDALEEAWAGVASCSGDGVEYRRWEDPPRGSTGWVSDAGGFVQHVLVTVDGRDVRIVTASGPGSRTLAEELISP